MTKLRKTATALLLTAAMLLTGCAEQKNTPAQDAGTNNPSSVSENDSSDSTSGSQNNTDSSQSDPESSSDVSVEPVPVEFTEEDRELQKILEELETGRQVICGWISSAEPDVPTKESRFLFPDGKINDYFLIPENYSEGGMIIPNTCDGMREIFLEYFSEKVTNVKMQEVGKGSMTENSDGTFSIILDEESKCNYWEKFIEINGAMYRQHSTGGKDFLQFANPVTAKVISKTDDTIEFTYLTGYWYNLNEDGSPKYINDTSLYAKNAITGVLKYERGGWKRDWDK